MAKILGTSAVFLCLAMAATAETDDAGQLATAIKLVHATMSLPPGTGVSFYEQQARSLGDRLAIAICKSVTIADLRDPNNGKRVLKLIRDAFSNLSFVTVPEDRNPGVTLLLLEQLVQQSGELDVQRQARELANSLEVLRHANTVK